MCLCVSLFFRFRFPETMADALKELSAEVSESEAGDSGSEDADDAEDIDVDDEEEEDEEDDGDGEEEEEEEREAGEAAFEPERSSVSPPPLGEVHARPYSCRLVV